MNADVFKGPWGGSKCRDSISQVSQHSTSHDYNPLVANTVFIVQTTRNCNCSEGKATILPLKYYSTSVYVCV